MPHRQSMSCTYHFSAAAYTGLTNSCSKISSFLVVLFLWFIKPIFQALLIDFDLKNCWQWLHTGALFPSLVSNVFTLNSIEAGISRSSHQLWGPNDQILAVWYPLIGPGCCTPCAVDRSCRNHWCARSLTPSSNLILNKAFGPVWHVVFHMRHKPTRKICFCFSNLRNWAVWQPICHQKSKNGKQFFPANAKNSF